MKRILSSIALCVGILCCTSCDPQEFLGQLFGNFLGEATLTISDPLQQTFYASQDTVKFSNSIADAWEDGGKNCVLSVAASINLTEADILNYPYFGIQINDTLVGSYDVTNVLDSIETIINLNVDNLLSTIEGKNLFIVAASDTCWYISKCGTINLTQLPGYGEEVTYTFNNVQAYYVTTHTINYVRDLMFRAQSGDYDAITELALLSNNYTLLLPVVTFNGEMTSRRFNVSGLVRMLRNNSEMK